MGPKEQYLSTVTKSCPFQQYWCKKGKDNKVTYINYKLFQIKMHLYAAI